MSKRKRASSSSTPSSSSDRRQWDRIFDRMKTMLQSQHKQIETLVDDRDFLEKYIQIQDDHLAFTKSFFESNITQLKKEETKRRKVEEAKYEVLLALREREAYCYRKRLEYAESDLEDFRICVEALGSELSALKEKLKTAESIRATTGDIASTSAANTNEEEHLCSNLEEKIRNLKASYEKLSSRKEAEVSSLLAEKDFVWNQLKTMESKLTSELKSKRIEVEQANEAVDKLQRHLEELQISIEEKEETIAQLNAKVELNRRKYNQEAEIANDKIVELESLVGKLKSDLAKCEASCSQLRNATVTPTERESRKRYRLRSSESVKDDANKKQKGSAKQNSESTDDDPNKNQKGSRKRVSESMKDNANEKRKRVNGGSSRLQASAPVPGLQRCSSRKRTRTSDSVNQYFGSRFKVPKTKAKPSAPFRTYDDAI